MVSGIWQEFLKIVQQEVGSQMVETWLKAVSLQHWDAYAKTVWLAAPNAFVRDWLRLHYLTLFEQHLCRLFNVDAIKVMFVDTYQAPEIQSSEIATMPMQEQNIVERSSKRYIPASVAFPHQSHAMVTAPRSKQSSHINSNYRFETFIVGPNNQLAYAAACAVTEKLGKIYNPLFMYGGSGLGKTHLLHAIGNAIKTHNKRATVLYQTTDRFVNEFINAIRFDKVHQFQTKYKDIDVLLIDDVQFISNKDQTQEAFFHIFNSLYDAHKQIVFSSDTYPQNMSGIAERLRSRLEWGLVADIQTPTVETKIAILKKKAEMNNIALSDEVAHFLASRMLANIRALEGSLIHVMAVASLTKQPITIELAKKVLVRSQQEAQGIVELERIIKQVCDHYSFTVQDLRSNSKTKEMSLARQTAMYLMKKMTNKSLQEIGFFLGRKDHSTVIHAVAKIQTYMKNDPGFSSQLVKIEEKILS